AGEPAVNVVIGSLYLVRARRSVAEADPADVLALGVAAEDARAGADADAVVAGPCAGRGVVLAAEADPAGVLRPGVTLEVAGAVVGHAPVARWAGAFAV